MFSTGAVYGSRSAMLFVVSFGAILHFIAFSVHSDARSFAASKLAFRALGFMPRLLLTAPLICTIAAIIEAVALEHRVDAFSITAREHPSRALMYVATSRLVISVKTTIDHVVTLPLDGNTLAYTVLFVTAVKLILIVT